MSALSQDLLLAREAAEAGARVVCEGFGKSKAARIKGDSNSVVTDTDLLAESAILDVLLSGSSYEILSEESGPSRIGGGPKWIVDPLDGTTNFLRSLPLFAVSVGLVDGSEALAGVIIDPIRHNEFYAQQGAGAFCNEERLLLPPYRADLGSALFLGHGYGETDRVRFADVSRRLAASYFLRNLGSTALELCYVANGSIDGFICSGDELWDFAAGIVIAKEAGCLFTDWRGRPWDGENSFVLIARPEVHGELVDQINDLQ